MGQRIIVGVSGASGVILAVKAIHACVEGGFDIDLVMSSGALYTAAYELGERFRTANRFLTHFPENVQERIALHRIHDIGASICSGSHLTAGMIIIPCSMATVGAVAHGLGDNALRRAADVTLKERRPLIIVPRETPLSSIHLENLLKISQAGGVVVPPVPAWYTEPNSLGDVEDFIVGKVLDTLGITHDLYRRWKREDCVAH